MRANGLRFRGGSILPFRTFADSLPAHASRTITRGALGRRTSYPAPFPFPPRKSTDAQRLSVNRAPQPVSRGVRCPRSAPTPVPPLRPQSLRSAVVSALQGSASACGQRPSPYGARLWTAAQGLCVHPGARPGNRVSVGGGGAKWPTIFWVCAKAEGRVRAMIASLAGRNQRRRIPR